LSRGPGLFLFLCGILAVPFSGCATPVDLFEPAWQSAQVPEAYDDRDWATVLRENVKNGLVDYQHLREHAEPLDRYLALIAAVGPETAPTLFESRRARLAYYINAYNAGVLEAVLHEGVPPTMHGVKRRLEYDYRLWIDGRPRTLAELRRAVRTESRGDVRVEFCLCDASLGSPPLQGRSFRPETLEQDLQRVAREAIDNSTMVAVNHEDERLNVSLVIHQRRKEFLDFHRRQTGTKSPTLLSALLHLASGLRREWLNTAVGYELGVLPFDRALNQWTRAAPTPRR
jgi:hypothetical protein